MAGFVDLVVHYWDHVLAVLVAASTLITIFLFTLPNSYDPYFPESVPCKQTIEVATSVQVVVLGDIGRSPRMQYHALSIAKHRGRVDIIGYQESDVHPDISANPLINIVPIKPTPRRLQTSNELLFLLLAPLKVLWQVWSLYHALGYRTKPAKWMLVQNPPSIPTLATAQFVCFFRNTHLLVDWHNFGYSILALKLGASHPLVRISRLYESICARRAYAHFTVTNAMARVLKSSFGLDAVPLHDRPAAHFQPLSVAERNSFLAKLPETVPYSQAMEAGRTRLLVSSTSWTPDEDFSILLDALVAYSSKASSNAALPHVLVIITGKGPQKEHYLLRVAALQEAKQLASVTILTAWLSIQDYAALLASADLGISLHTSSSGVDLPMKVVDMFGAGLPVLGWSRFEAWPELVHEGDNGRGFGSAEDLNSLLVELFGDKGEKLKKLRDGARRECERRWDAEWDPVAGRVLGLVR